MSDNLADEIQEDLDLLMKYRHMSLKGLMEHADRQAEEIAVKRAEIFDALKELEDVPGSSLASKVRKLKAWYQEMCQSAVLDR